MAVKPYQMCSLQECNERESTGEVSIWELVDNTGWHNHSENSVPTESSSSLSLVGVRESEELHRRTIGTPSNRRGRGRGRNDAGGRKGKRDSNYNNNDDRIKNNLSMNNKRKLSTQQASRIKIDPCRAIQKYRRSAAGLNEDGSAPYRTVDDLEVTLHYLVHLMVHNSIGMQNSITQNSNKKNNNENFRSLVDFFQDRVRAVQVDCTKLQAHVSLSLQAKVIRAQIIILYLLGDSDDYETNFGQRALTTSLLSFWKDYQHDLNKDEKYTEQQQEQRQHIVDEMIHYHTILDLSKDICNSGDDGEIIIRQMVLEAFRSLQQEQQQSNQFHNSSCLTLPWFQWGLQLVIQCSLGNWYNVLKQLSSTSTFKATNVTRFQCIDSSSRILTITNCLMAEALPKIRWKALQAYNVSWNKGEKVILSDLASLLRVPKSTTILTLAKNYGLPILSLKETEDSNYEEMAVIFKTEPIQAYNSDTTRKRRTLRDDDFVFQINSSSDDDNSKSHWRVDQKGLRIPSVQTMEKLVFGR